MDTEQALLTAIWYRLTLDEQLKSIMNGTVKLDLGYADKDREFPYLVNRLDSIELDPWVIRRGTYYLDIWDRAQTSHRVYNLRSQIVRILDRSYIGLIDPDDSFMSVSQPTSGEPKPILVAARMYLATSGLIPEDTVNIWHFVLQFDMRFTRSIQEIQHLCGC